MVAASDGCSYFLSHRETLRKRGFDVGGIEGVADHLELADEATGGWPITFGFAARPP
ncbi:MAG: hypothetical protein P9L99_00465 [Candidatus Lernaella stagnicola]|nr:hypothetical protein [Candidatus Lernaella stagnicola]